MTHRPGVWELFAAGAAVGGTGVWGLAAAARVGVLRMLLELFPASWWDTVTWGLIPALLLASPVVQGAVVTHLARTRPGPAAPARGVWGSLAGSAVGGVVLGAVLLLGVRRLPPPAVAALARTVTVPLIIAFLGILLVGWVLVAGLVFGLGWLRLAALPLGVAGTACAWLLVPGHVLALSDVLDRPEAQGFFASVALGGGAGAAWALRPVRTPEAEAASESEQAPEPGPAPDPAQTP